MNIWIVEDTESDALKAIGAVMAAVPSMSLQSTRLYWDRTLHWEPHLYDIQLSEGQPRLSNSTVIGRLTPEVAPTIVVLDLLDRHLKFKAHHFLSALRTWEVEQQVPPSFVIIWSVQSGNPQVTEWVNLEPRRDWRVRWLGTKGDVALTRAVQGYLRTELELKHQ